MPFPHEPTCQIPRASIANEVTGPSPYLELTTEGEDPVWLEALHARLVATLDPLDPVEAHLVWRLGTAMWRSRRADRLESEALVRPEAPERLELAMRYRSQQLAEIKESLALLSRHRAAAMRPGTDATGRPHGTPAAGLEDRHSGEEPVRNPDVWLAGLEASGDPDFWGLEERSANSNQPPSPAARSEQV
jgi:hypothetical protein